MSFALIKIPTMKKLLLPMVSLLSTLTVQAQSVNWSDFSANTGARDAITSTAYDNAGNRYVSGWFIGILIIQGDTLVNSYDPVDNYYSSQPDAFAAKFNENGDLVWLKQFGGSDWQIGCDIVVNPTTQECYMTGMFGAEITFGATTIDSLPGNYSARPYIVKLGAEGGIAWYRYFYSLYYTEGGYTVDLNDSGNEVYMIAEYVGDLYANDDTLGYAAGMHSIVGMETVSGEVIDQFGISSYLSTLHLVQCNHNDEVIVAGESGWNGVIYKLNSDLTSLLETTVFDGPSLFEGVKSLTVDDNSNLYALVYIPDTTNVVVSSDTINTIIPTPGTKNMAIIKFDANGHWKYSKTYMANDLRVDWHANDLEAAFTADKSGNIYVGGSFYGDLTVQGNTISNSTHPIYYQYDAFVFKLNKKGNLRWLSHITQSNGGELLGLDTYQNNILIGGLNDGDFAYDLLNATTDAHASYVMELSDCDYTANITSTGTVVSPGLPQTLSTPYVAYYSYQWQRNGISLAGATSNTYSTDQKGNYRCLITANGCSKLSNKIKFTNPPRLGELENNEVTTYPNPTSGNFTINAAGFDNMLVNIRITSITGEVVFTQSNCQLPFTMQMPENAAAGTYVIDIQGDSLQSHSSLIIQK